MAHCSATQSQQSWERGVEGPLINIQPLSVSKHTNTENAAYLPKQVDTAAHTQTCINTCGYLHINSLIGIVRCVWSDRSSPHDSFHTHLLATIWTFSVFPS